MSIFRKLWEFWKAFGMVLGHVQSTILLAIIYHIAVGPISILGKVLRNDVLGLRVPQGDSFAVTLPPITTTLQRAEKQY